MRIVNKMLNHSLDAAMMTWKDHARKEQRATTVCSRVVSHWLHRCKANAFESWHLHAKEQRRMEDLCSRVLRWRFQKLRRASLWWLSASHMPNRSACSNCCEWSSGTCST